jgi:hypothetical protein
MRLMIVVLVILACACAKKKSEDKSAAPPPATEQAAPAAPTELPKAEGGVTGAGSADPKATMPSDDGGEAKANMPKPMPADDGGEATKKACTQTSECGTNHDCCNGFCFKQGSPKHSIECKLPAGKL